MKMVNGIVLDVNYLSMIVNILNVLNVLEHRCDAS